MNLTKTISKIFKDSKKFMFEHSPEILASVGVAGFFSSIGLAIKVTPEAYDKLEEKKEDLNVEKLPVVEVVKTVWKDYIPVAITAGAATGCVFGSVSTSLRRNAALVTAYEILDNNVRTYKEKVVETIGEKKEKAIRDAAAEENANTTPPKEGVNIYMPDENGDRKVLFFEPLTCQYFWMNYEDMRTTINDFLEERRSDPFGQDSAYEWLSRLPYQVTSVLPDAMTQRFMDIGWGEDIALNIEFSSHKVPDGKYKGYPYNAIDYSEMPRADYERIY